MQKSKRYKDERLNFAVDELTTYRELQRRIAFLKKRRQDYEDQYSALKSVIYDDIKVEGGNWHNSVEDIAVRKAMLDAEIAKLQKDAEHSMYIIDVRLQKLSALHREVLWLYYIEFKSIMDVAREMGYSFEGIRTLKSKALKNYANY